VRFSSEPDLPEDEVLARLLFGRGIATLSAFQAAQLAASVATLTGQGGEGLLDGLRENFGLDDLDVTTDDEGGVAVRAGRYLSDNVYTDVVVSEGQTSIEIHLDLTRSVTVTGRASDDGESSIGIYFERDY
jgi:translocation and assembly module TamB